MATFVVERNLPGLTEKHLAALQEALGEASRRLSTNHETVRYVQSTYDLARGRCTCSFEATSRAAVVKVNEIAQVPFLTISPVP
jgi:Protein of unknown function (DUF4242)